MNSLVLAINGQTDVDQARRSARALAQSLGFDRAQTEAVALAVSELATNLVRYARQGELEINALQAAGSRGVGLEIQSRDSGPGMIDTEAALRDGFSTSGGLGSGLPGVRRLMDEFELSSSPAGSTVTCRTWRRPT